MKTLADYPDLCAQLHPTKNGVFSTQKYSSGSNKLLWWRCSIAEDHVWAAKLVSRTHQAQGCPFCSGRRVSRTNSLATMFPKIASQFHPNLNGDLTPETVTAGTGKKVWWKCPKGDDHIWEASVVGRTHGNRKGNCPFCLNQRISSTNNLAHHYPEIAKQWHSSKNGLLKASDVTPGSSLKVWWQCNVAEDHVWDAPPKSRIGQEYGCPFCSGKRVSKSNSLRSLHPNLATMWHPTKNGDVTPDDITAGSGRRFWWKCPKGDDHVFQAQLVAFKDGKVQCPYCTGYKVGADNNLQFVKPAVASEWHPKKNNGLEPVNFFCRSSKKVWWQCSKHSEHEWQATIHNRAVHGTTCPYCANKRVCDTNSLATLFPNIAKELHPLKNVTIKPTDILPGSNRKVWWQCPVAVDHVWKAGLNSRTGRGDGCPFCSVIPKQASSTNNLALNHPEIAKYWHPTMNGELTPDKVLSNTTKKVWWLCNDGHYYDASVNGRVSRIQHCPYCAGRRIGQGNSFADKYPEAAAEWDYEKNKDKTPDKFSPTSHRKYWFKCKLDHSYKTSLASKSGGSGCPKCTNQASQPELRIYTELKHIFPDTEHKHILNKVEFDVFIPSRRLAIEFDGSYWHRNADAKDRRKNTFCSVNGIELVRVRQEPLEKIRETDVIVTKGRFTKAVMDEVIKRLFFEIFTFEFTDNRINKYLTSKTFLNEALFQEYRTYFPMPHPSKSLATLRPELGKFWDYEKNYPLTPEHFTTGSNRRVFWTCRKGHSYQTTIVDRAKAVGCPTCYKTRGRGRNKHPTINDQRQMKLI